MSTSRHSTVYFILLITLIVLSSTPIDARRKHNHRSSLESLKSLAQSEYWTVPLQGAETCISAQNCTDHLPSVPPLSNLQHIAIGRGTITYTCAGQQPNATPIYVGQNAFLYDVGSLVSKFASEEQFHSYIPRFLQYDYTSQDNSSLNCIGDIQRINGLAVFDLYQEAAFTVTVKAVVSSPNDTQFDLQWSYSTNDDMTWDIYRVETASGGPPYNCGGQVISDEIPVEYAAEYWIYRRTTNTLNRRAKILNEIRQRK